MTEGWIPACAGMTEGKWWKNSFLKALYNKAFRSELPILII